MNGIKKLDWSLLSTPTVYNGTRAHTLKLQKEQIRLNDRKNFSNQKVIDYWNALPQSAIDAKSINRFKDHLAFSTQRVNNLTQVPQEHVMHILTKAYESARKINNHKFRHIVVNTSQYRQSFFPKTVGQ